MIMLNILFFSLFSFIPDSPKDIPFPDDIFFRSIGDMVCDRSGNLIYVLDSAAAEIQVISREGSFIKTIGRKGQGPGEFNRPSSLVITPSGELYVTDQLAQKVVIFDQVGNHLRDITLPGLPPARLMYLNESQLLVGHQKEYALYFSRQQRPSDRPIFSMIESGEKSAEVKARGQYKDDYIAAIMGDALPFKHKDRILLLYRFHNAIDVFNHQLTEHKEIPYALPFVPEEPTSEIVKVNGEEVFSPSIDCLVRDAVMGPDGHIYILMSTQSQSRMKKPPPQKLYRLDPDSLKMVALIDIPAEARMFDMWADGSLLMLNGSGGSYEGFLTFSSIFQ
jgi:hypothetical protein